MVRKAFGNYLFAQVAAGAIVAPGTAFAAQPEATAGRESSEIVVTAQRRAERSRDVPISITSIPSEVLRQANIQELRDIPRLTPALRFDNNGAFTQPTIRGIGTSITNAGAGANVGIYVDGFYSPNPLAADLQLMNVQSIQVLKGPQGTLFGRNTTGGAILVTTAQPSSEPGAKAEVSYARFNAQRYQAYATAPIGPNVAIDIEGLYRKGDGFIRNVVTGDDKPGAYEAFAIRTGVKVFLSDTASILLRYAHSDTEDPTQVAAGAYERGGQIFSSGPARGGVAATRRREISIDGRAGFKIRSNSFQGTANIDLGFADFTSYTQYRKDRIEQSLDLDYSSAPAFMLQIPGSDATFTQEFLLSSDRNDRLKWTAGLFYFNNRSLFPANRASIGGGPFNLVSGSGTTTRAYAAFADVTYQIVDRLYLTGGLRYSRDQVLDAFLVNLASGARVPVAAAKTSRVIPRAVVRFETSSNSSVYASFSRGYKAGILNPLGSPDLQYIRPETITAYEGGFKYGDGALSLDLAGYYYTYKNIQIASREAGQNLLTNAANSRIYGAEAQVRYQVDRNFQISGGAAYTNARYKDFLTAPFYNQLPSGVFAITQTDASGNPMQRAPDFTANLAARYEVELAGGTAALSGNWYHTSQVYFDPSRQFPQDGYDLFGAKVEWTDPSDRFTVAVFAENLSDEKYRVQANANTFGVASVWGQPRTVGVSFRAALGSTD